MYQLRSLNHLRINSFPLHSGEKSSKLRKQHSQCRNKYSKMKILTQMMKWLDLCRTKK